MNMKRDEFVGYQSHYSDSGLWKKIREVAKQAGLKVVYLALLLYYLLKDPNVSVKDKAIIYGALGYFILPLDLIPDTIPVVGFMDDLSALLYAVRSVWVNITPEIQAKARTRLHDLFGRYDSSVLDNLIV
jgi:uncharacterized membrane protein YkvA (DUF1232 family)